MNHESELNDKSIGFRVWEKEGRTCVTSADTRRLPLTDCVSVMDRAFHSDPHQFLITPYNVYLYVLVYVALSNKSKMSARDVGAFARIIMRLIQSLDSPFADVRNCLTVAKLFKIRDDADAKIESMKVQGMGSLIEMISSMKVLPEKTIHKSSFLGLFVRRMDLCAEKLSFTALSLLFQELTDYFSEKDKSRAGQETRTLLWKNCPKQVNYFFSKQVNLMNVNEKLALDPKSLSTLIDSAYSSTDRNQTMSTNVNELLFVRYMNCLRVNDFVAARHALNAYFDSSPSQSSKCWALYNTATLHYHFGHSDLCLEAIRDCIAASQESNDDRCLEYSLLILAKLMIRKKDKDVMSLLSHLSGQGCKDLPAISVMAGLHLEQLQHPAAADIMSPESSNLEVMAVKHSLNEVLGMIYVNRAAHFSAVCSQDLALLSSQVLLHLHAVEPIGNDMVFYVNENMCIALRNVAMHLWHNCGNFDSACDLLVGLAAKLFSSYSSLVNSIHEQALAEIHFEHHLYRNNWKEARAALDRIRIHSGTEYQLRHVQFLVKKKNLKDSYDLLKDLIARSDDLPEHFNLRVMMMKAEILKDVTEIVKCIEFAEKKRLKGLLSKCHLLLARNLFERQMYTQALSALRKVMLLIVSNGSVHDSALCNHLYALIQCSTGHTARIRESSLRYNQIAIEKFSLINDIENLKHALILQSNLHHELGNTEERNFCAKQIRVCSA